MSRSSRLILTLLASVLLHAVLLGVLSRALSASPSKQPVSSRPVELEIVSSTEPPRSPALPPPAMPPPSRASPQLSRRTQRPPPPAPVAQKTEEPAAPERSEPKEEDVPRAEPPRLSLLPKNLPGGVAVEEPAPRGQTLRNLPGEEPDPEAVAAYQAEQAKARVDGWISDTLAVARVEGGAPSPYFQRLQAAFSEELVNPPSPDAEVVARRVVRGEINAIQRFGEKGSPTEAPEKREHQLEQRNRLQAASEQGRARSMYMMDVTAPILALAAVVEVWQEPSGKLVDMRVIESSGDPTFDGWALSRLRDALARTSAPPDAGVGIHDDGMRSRWRLEEYLGNPRVRIRLLGIY